MKERRGWSRGEEERVGGRVEEREKENGVERRSVNATITQEC